jgi:predicted porin
MNKYLLGTSALVAAAVATAPAAQAAEPIKIAIRGYYSAGVSVTDEDIDDRQSVHVRQDGEIHFRGETTLDNGLVVGVRVELEAFTTDDQIDEHYVYFEGTFGRLIIGANDHVSEAMHDYVPTATPGGSDTPDYFLFDDSEGLTPNSAGEEVGDENKIIYFTPRFNGFQLGVSFAPNTDQISSGGVGGQYGTLPTLWAPDINESYAFGFNFVQEFNDVGVSFGATYELGSVKDGKDQDSVGAHAYVSFDGFTVGASGKMTDPGDVDPTVDDWYVVGVGGLYEMGPWAVSLGGTYQEKTEEGGPGKVHTYLVDLGVNYTLGPGVSVFAFGQYWRLRDRDADFLENDGIGVMVGTALDF